MPPPLSPVGDTARQHDPDEFLAALFWPLAQREGLFTLIALRHELASIKAKISEPMLGQIRLQWWMEAIEALAPDKTPPAHPVLQAVHTLLGKQPGLKPALLDLVGSYESDFAEQAEYATRAAAYWQAKLELAGLSGGENAQFLAVCVQAQSFQDEVLAGQSRESLPANTAELRRELAQLRPKGLAKIVFLPRITLGLWLKTLQRCAFQPQHPALRQPSAWRVLALVWAVYLR
jgi:hypothetical protein